MVGVEFGVLGGVASDGGFEVVVGDAGGEQGEVGGVAEDAPGVVGAGVGGYGFGQADGAGEGVEVFAAAGADVDFIRAFADDGVEAELGEGGRGSR